ncbi:MAG TPA: hypothetical protein VNS79_11185 [Sphingobium sp.]|nr:hypothetical protein [Sphingobium sp.]
MESWTIVTQVQKKVTTRHRIGPKGRFGFPIDLAERPAPTAITARGIALEKLAVTLEDLKPFTRGLMIFVEPGDSQQVELTSW